jgi:cytochrome c oxidase cbb3-type subunit I
MNLMDRLFPDRPDAAAKIMLVSAIFWGVMGTTYGFFMALQFVLPDLTKDIAWLSFSRIRPTHVNTVALVWISMASVGACFYMLPRLLKTPLWNERLGCFTAWIWNIFAVLIPLTLLNGLSEGREWAELIAPMDWLFLVILALTGLNVFMTVSQRKEQQLYVSVWYFMASMIGLTLVFIIGNRTFVALDGLNDAITNWFYAHDVLGLWITTMGVGITYYLLPKLTVGPNGEPGNAIFSHRMSLIGFWGIIAFYTGIGAHHIIQSPVPEWLKTYAVGSSVLMSIPVYAVSVNFFMTTQGRWTNLAWNIPLRFVTFGWIAYALASFQGSLQSIRSFNAYQHFTGIVSSHAHLALLGGFSAILWGALYYAIPRLYKVEWYSKRLANLHFWAFSMGFLVFFLSWTTYGFIQAAGWNFGISVQQLVPWLKPYLLVRWIGAAIMIYGIYIFAYNTLQTIRAAKRSAVSATPAMIGVGAAADD